ncbi:MAG: MbnP family protein [Saprospiraceae bacterium]
MSGRINNLFIGKWILLLCCILSIISCKEDKEGCKDITASNWDASADKSCEDCCTFPSLKFEWTHVYADTSFSYGDPLTDEFDNVYTITSIRYYLSNISFTTNGEEYLVTDSITASVYADTGFVEQEVRDDVLFVTQGTSTSTVGDFRSNGQFLDSLTLSIGVVQPLNSVGPGSVPNTHPLAPKADSMYWDVTRGYIFQRIKIVPDTAMTDTLLLEIGGDAVVQTTTLPYGQSTVSGFDLSVPLKIDYKCWFEGINFAEATEEEMEAQIVTNLAKGFSVSE